MADTFFGIQGAGQNNDEIAQRGASGKITNGMRQAGAAYSNKRQSDRDFYGNALNNRAASYQGAMNMLGASGGGTPNLAGLDRANNPLTLQGTGIGATEGSNWTGWDQPSPGKSPDGTPYRGGHVNGIQDYLSGTGYQTGTIAGHDGTPDVSYSNAYNLPAGGPTGAGPGGLNTAPMGGQLATTGSATAPMWATSAPPPAQAAAPPPSPGQNFNFGRKP